MSSASGLNARSNTSARARPLLRGFLTVTRRPAPFLRRGAGCRRTVSRRSLVFKSYVRGASCAPPPRAQRGLSCLCRTNAPHSLLCLVAVLAVSSAKMCICTALLRVPVLLRSACERHCKSALGQAARLFSGSRARTRSSST